jgi:two-component sensor histidine kinase
MRQTPLLHLVRRLRPLRRWPAWARYAGGLLLLLTALAVRLALEGVYQYPFITFFPAVFLAASLFGRGPGLLAALLGGALAFWFFVEPRHGAALLMPDRVAAHAASIALGLLTAWVVDAAMASVEELGDANDRLEEAIRKLAAADAQKAVLLDDINHRLKNSLHAIAGILAAEGRRAGEPDLRVALEDAAGRLRVLARAHERLHLGPGADDASSVDMPGFLGALCADLQPTLVDLRPVVLRATADSIRLGVARAIPLGLIVNELATNAVRHAFPEDREGTISVRLRRAEKGMLLLEVSDNGVGTASGGADGGSGTRLIRALAQQLGGSVEREITPHGTRVAVRFPEAEPG